MAAAGSVAGQQTPQLQEVLLLGESGERVSRDIPQEQLQAENAGWACKALSLLASDGGDRVILDLLAGTLPGESAGASAAVLLIDGSSRGAAALEVSMAPGGVTDVHIQLAAALGFRALTVLIVDDDAVVGPREQRFDEVRSNVVLHLEHAGFKAAGIACIPHSLEKQAWYTGPTLSEALSRACQQADESNATAALASHCLRMPVQEVYKVGGRDVVVVAAVEAGTVRKSETLAVSPPGVEKLFIESMEDEAGNEIQEGAAGQVVRLIGVSGSSKKDPGWRPGTGGEPETSRGGAQGSHQASNGKSASGREERPPVPASLVVGAVISEMYRHPCKDCSKFLALIAVRAVPVGSAAGIREGYQVTLDVHAAHVPCVFKALQWRRRCGATSGSQTLQPQRAGAAVQAGQLEWKPKSLVAGDMAEVWLEPLAPVCLEVFSVCPPLGRFALRDSCSRMGGGATLVAGVVRMVHLAGSPYAYFDD
eukprot:TRINITY_DN31008_c0_g1_i1.p1 TRINITY_DN31008_c0_g1~~TRINITY_DN31008_c0_g1_i1.p1  ORF type:complete len:480 (-),score=103.33 TRINITY_DN31008_c0_g1_i1:69-1508(-)